MGNKPSAEARQIALLSHSRERDPSSASWLHRFRDIIERALHANDRATIQFVLDETDFVAMERSHAAQWFAEFKDTPPRAAQGTSQQRAKSHYIKKSNHSRRRTIASPIRWG